MSADNLQRRQKEKLQNILFHVNCSKTDANVRKETRKRWIRGEFLLILIVWPAISETREKGIT